MWRWSELSVWLLRIWICNWIQKVNYTPGLFSFIYFLFSLFQLLWFLLQIIWAAGSVNVIAARVEWENVIYSASLTIQIERAGQTDRANGPLVHCQGQMVQLNVNSSEFIISLFNHEQVIVVDDIIIASARVNWVNWTCLSACCSARKTIWTIWTTCPLLNQWQFES